MKLTSKIVALSCTLLFSNFAIASTDDAIAAAEKARQAAADVGYEWRDTAKMIKKAKELAAKGNSDEAIKLAKRAEEEGIDALKQYQSELKRFTKVK